MIIPSFYFNHNKLNKRRKLKMKRKLALLICATMIFSTAFATVQVSAEYEDTTFANCKDLFNGGTGR